MMNTVNENPQLDDSQEFLPQKLEQDYLSCLLGTDDLSPEDTELEKTKFEAIDSKETKSELLEVKQVQSEQVASQNDEQKESLKDSQDDEKELASECLLESKQLDTDEVLHEGVSEASAGSEEMDAGNEASNDKEATERYMSIAELSVSPPFVCQLMLVAGVKFAVPLANFSRVIAVPENVQVNSNATSICCGKFEWQDKSMFLLALKRMIQPNNTKQDEIFNESDKIVLIENDGFGFVCNQMLETITISPEEVLWRDSSSQRYWLAGMAKQAGVAILDVKGILHSATGNRQSVTNN